MHANGHKLFCDVGLPEKIIPKLVETIQSRNDAHEIVVYCHSDVTREEVTVERKLLKALALLNPPVKLVLVDGVNTLHHPDDLPFTLNNTPMVFTQFRKAVEASHKPIRTVSKVKDWKLPYQGELPPASGLPPRLNLNHDERSVFPFEGGETTGILRVMEYIEKHITLYKQTRNGLLGVDYSSKWSAWLAFGAISPRYIYHQLAKNQKQKWDEGSDWMVFELLWRDFWKFHAAKVGTRLFHWNGVSNVETPHQVPKLSSQQAKLARAWKDGNTGYPLVDASMRELKLTGFLSNRSRQNVASFLVHNLKCPWLYGAEYFESQLVDYDVCSNYGNWQYAAGCGVDPRQRVFNVIKQAKDYDPKGEYIVQWIPELKHVLTTQAIFTPWLTQVSYEKDYPRPIVPPQSSHYAFTGKLSDKVDGKARTSDWKIK